MGLFLVFGTTLYAQRQVPSTLRGKVTHEDLGITDVHVMNLSADRATITNDQGYFTLEARPGDTLLFSAVQFRRKSLVVSQTMLQSLQIRVPLEEFVNELEEVVLRPYNLSGDISRDLGQMPGGNVVVASTLGLPNAYVKPATQAERKLYEATSGGGILPLNPILNGISGRTRYLKKVLENEKVYARTNRVREFYSDSLFVRDLGIPLSKIDDFMYYCEVDPMFSGLVDSADRLKIWEFLKSKSLGYRRDNSLE